MERAQRHESEVMTSIVTNTKNMYLNKTANTRSNFGI